MFGLNRIFFAESLILDSSKLKDAEVKTGEVKTGRFIMLKNGPLAFLAVQIFLISLMLYLCCFYILYFWNMVGQMYSVQFCSKKQISIF